MLLFSVTHSWSYNSVFSLIRNLLNNSLELPKNSALLVLEKKKKKVAMIHAFIFGEMLHKRQLSIFRKDSSVQFSHSVVSDSLQPHESQHARPPCHYQLPEFTQTYVHWVSDAIQPSHPLPSPSPPAPNSSQHHSLFQWVNSSHEVAKVLEFQL